MTFAVKNKDQIDPIWGKENCKRDSFDVQTKNAQPDAKASTGDTRNVQHNTIFVLTFLLRLLMETAWPENYPSHLHSTSSMSAFSFPVDMNFGWPRKAATHSYQHKYFISQFYNHSTHIKLPKINAFLPIQLPNILLLNLTHVLITTNTIINTFLFLLFVNIVVKFFPCLFVVWFASPCFVLSLQPYAWYNKL